MLWYYLPGHLKYSSSSRSTRIPPRCTRLSTCSTRMSNRRTRLSTRSICLSTRSTHSTICQSFYN